MTQENIPEALRNPSMADVLKKANNIALNLHLRKVIEVLDELPNPATRMGILMMAQAVTFRCICEQRGARTIPQKQTLLRFATKDFREKIELYGFQQTPPASQVRDADSK